MAIEKKSFDNELELDIWVQNNFTQFFGDVIYIPGNFFINTKRNKGSKPDGFILDLKNNSWSIVEVELLKHGVWDHIAEQIIRFIVAVNNSVSQRKIRDLFFSEIEKRGLIKNLVIKLNELESRIIQRIETIVESQLPDIVLFIDELNEDLEDMVEALNATVRVYQVQKYLVNGSIEYLAPQGNKTIIETTVEEVKDTQGRILNTLDLLGGGKHVSTSGNIKFYSLGNGDLFSIKYSKRYDTDVPFWYGITPSALEKYRNSKIKYLVFILGEDGLIRLPFGILEEYLQNANTTNNSDGSIKHYHVFIKVDPIKCLYINQVKKQWNLEEYYYEYE